MFKALFLIASLTVITSSAFAQNTEDIIRLHSWLELSPATTILPSSSSPLRATPVLKLYLATGTDQRAYSQFSQWIDKWNQTDGKQFGKLEVIADLQAADLIIARFNGDTEVERRGSIGTSPTMATVPLPSQGSRIGTRTVVYRPLYAYLVAQTPNALEIVYRHVDRSTNHEDPNGNLFNELKKKLKQR